jgi:hypothetical protein
MEKLGAAARVIDDSTAAGERLRRWKMSLRNRAGAVTGILEELTASGMDEGVGTDHPVHAAITYIQSHSADADRMNYARARRLGLALGTGNVEATCKSLFETRMKRCGARWKEETGQHIVQLRALALSDRWEPAIELTLDPGKALSAELLVSAGERLRSAMETECLQAGFKSLAEFGRIYPATIAKTSLRGIGRAR